YTEQTLRLNQDDLQRLLLRPRVLADVAQRSQATTMAGQPVSLPFALAPIGMSGMAHQDGEIHACRAAEAAGIPYILSTMSICSIEDVAAAVRKPFWFQLYIMKDRGFIRELIQRAIAAKCSALVLTVDLQVLGQRHRDLKNGLSVPPEIKLGTFMRIAARPRWAIGVLGGKRKTFGNLDGRIAGMEGVRSLSQWTAQQFDQALSWNDVDWVRGLWPGPLILKGIMDEDDARRAVTSGATGIVVSNHGGRQLDGAPSSISVLPRIADAVGSAIEVLFDGGIRSGQDVMRALALGARGCLLGRAYVYGLCAGGEAGVRRAIEIVGSELDVTMALTGARSIADIDRRVIVD
ncbi:MAG: alpha-hydroxy-acid oxidizing protein, partial [Hyphomicrobium sp.]|nr:alpha-hydroxy-acid oxidizing protein [Hyphomicrobium sp.]